MKKLVIGTRGSALALAQTELARQALVAAHPELAIEVRTIRTAGDRGAQPDHRAGLKGLFTREIERVLGAGVIDIAVHSLKDLPGQPVAGLEIAAVLERAAATDVLVIKRSPVRVIGTSSVRRVRQLQWSRPGIEVRALRGNVPTRLEMLRTDPELDAIVLARAGIDRLGIELNGLGFSAEALDILPAAGQGIIALQTRADDVQTRTLLQPLDHPPTRICARFEREFLRLLHGDCNLPVGVRTALVGTTLHAEAVVFGEEAAAPRHGRIAGPAANAEQLAAQLFQEMYAL